MGWRFAIGLCLAAVLWTGIALSQEPPPEPGQGQPVERGEGQRPVEGQPEPEQDEADAGEAVVEQEGEPAAAGDDEAGEAGGEQDRVDGTQSGQNIVNYTYWLTAFTGLLFAATAVLAVFTIVLAVTTIRNGRRQLRAYVGVPTMKLKPTPSPDITPNRCIVTVENTGLTPAYELSAFLNWWWDERCSDDLPNDFGFGDFADREPQSVAVIGANRPLTITFGIDGEMINRVRRREISLWYYGHIDYRDVFRKRRTTEYCFAFQHTEWGTIAVTVYNRHNDAT